MDRGIKRLSIRGLYGRGNYDLLFNHSGINIITAPNGYGKTTILNVVSGVLQNNLFGFLRLDFSEIELESFDGIKLTFAKNNNQFFCNRKRFIVPSLIENTEEGIRFELSLEDISYFYEGEPHRRGGVFRRGPMRPWTYNVVSDVIEGDVVVAINGFCSRDAKKENELLALKKNVEAFQKAVGSSLFVDAGRLYERTSVRAAVKRESTQSIYRKKITMIPDVMARILQKYNNMYSATSKSIDSVFFAQLTKAISQSDSSKDSDRPYTIEDYTADLKKVFEKLEKIQESGILVGRKDNVETLSDFNAKYGFIYQTFMKNWDKKLSVYEPLINKVSLFKDIINSKLEFSSLSLDYFDGLVVSEKSNNKAFIPLDALSSGEQELVVMFFGLLFDEELSSINLRSQKEISQPDQTAVVLIDEPEISLHVSWQIEIIDDLKKINSTISHPKQFVIATHSPQIINNHWDEVFDLTECEVPNCGE